MRTSLRDITLRLNTPESSEGDVMTLLALVRGAGLFATRMEVSQERWEKGDYTEEEQRHVACLTRAFVGLVRSLEKDGEDPMLWLGVLALGEFTPASDVFLKVDPPKGFEGVMIHRGSDDNPLNRG